MIYTCFDPGRDIGNVRRTVYRNSHAHPIFWAGKDRLVLPGGQSVCDNTTFCAVHAGLVGNNDRIGEYVHFAPILHGGVSVGFPRYDLQAFMPIVEIAEVNFTSFAEMLCEEIAKQGRYYVHEDRLERFQIDAKKTPKLLLELDAEARRDPVSVRYFRTMYKSLMNHHSLDDSDCAFFRSSFGIATVATARRMCRGRI